MVWLPDGEKSSKTRLLVSTEYTNVTDGQTDRQTPHGSIGRVYAYDEYDDHNAALLKSFKLKL